MLELPFQYPMLACSSQLGVGHSLARIRYEMESQQGQDMLVSSKATNFPPESL
jgi:hypothetical protein